jgi:adenylate kinase
MTVIIISGTPGTGKTTLAKIIAKFGYRRIDVNRLVNQKRLYAGYDRKRGSKIVDTDRLTKELARLITSSRNKKMVVDSHLSHYLPPDYVDLCIVTKCDLKELEKRYNQAKVRENLDAEIFDICYNEAKEFGHKVVVVDTTDGIVPSKIKKILGT